MNKTLISRLVIGALATITAGTVMAGQIQSSSTPVAREAIVSDAQQVVSPTVSYSFAGPINASASATNTTFQTQITLNSTAEWDTTITPSDNAFVIWDGIAAIPPANYQIIGKGYSADKKTLWATFSMIAPAAGLISTPVVVMNAQGATTPAKLLKLKSVVGDLKTDFDAGKCSDNKNLNISFQHFIALSNNNAIADGSTNGVADEHVRPSNTSSGTLFVFPTNLLLNFSKATAGASLSPSGSLQFAYAGGAPVAVPLVVGGLSTSSWTGAATDAIGAVNNTAYLGSVSVKQNGTGYDSSLKNTEAYLLGAVGKGIVQKASAVLNDGTIETTSVNIDVSATNGFVKGGTLFLRAAPVAALAGVAPTVACSGAAIADATASVAITDANKDSPSISLKLTSNAGILAAFGATGLDGVQVCYTVPGSASIPASQFSASAVIVKAPDGGLVGGGVANEQNNYCSGGLFSLGGGLKIDVRNYASSSETSGYQSVIRLINNSDSRTADVWGQIIHQNGQFGGYGLLTTLAPRQVLNMSAKQIDALLVKTPIAATAANNGAVAPAAAATGAPRLRITSQSGNSLRVQNYLFNSATGQILEGSNAQAVDFDGNLNRAPGSDGQYISQDANSGLNGN